MTDAMTDEEIQTTPAAEPTPLAAESTSPAAGQTPAAAVEAHRDGRNGADGANGGGRGNRPPKARKPHGQQPQGQQPQGARNRNGQPQPQGGDRNARPARQVHPVLEKLFELHPKLFGARFLPLKLGTYEDIVARHPDVFKTDDLKVAMGLHARSTRYLEAVAAGLARHDLDGNPVEPVAAEHVHHAIMEVFRRKQARTKDDLRPQLQARIIAAIEASGLSREAYAERVRGRDEVAGAALDDAVAELGRQAAKREALLRAFEASGKSEAEFADMYGMDPAEVVATLHRARADKAA